MYTRLITYFTLLIYVFENRSVNLFTCFVSENMNQAILLYPNVHSKGYEVKFYQSPKHLYSVTSF